MVTNNQKETQKPMPIPDGFIHLASQLLRPEIEIESPKIFSFESQWDLHPRDPPGYSKQETILKFSLGFCPLGIIFNLKDKKP